MLPTAARLARAPGILKRTTDELSRVSKMVWNLEHHHIPTKPLYLLDFEKEESVLQCKTMADRAVGGYSTANLDYVPADPSTNSPAHARFHGSISTKLPMNWRVERTGYAAFRNRDRTWLFGKLLWELDPYAYFAVRVKSDGRRYTVNVQTDSIIETDIHQHRLYTHHHRLPRSSSSDVDAESLESDIPAGLRDLPPPSSAPGPTLSYTSTPNPEATGWETIYIPWQQFVRTNNGYAVAPQTGPMTNKIKSVGIGLTDRAEGPYDLRIHRMWASNGLSPEEVEEEKRICGFVTVPTETDENTDVPIANQEAEQLHRFKNLKPRRKKGDE